jgi:plasmid stabilization system protein ParE
MQAAEDLAAIKEFIGRDSPTYARRVVEQLYEAVGELVAFPDIGRVVPEAARYISARFSGLRTASFTGAQRTWSKSSRSITLRVCFLRISSRALSNKRLKLAARLD